MPVIDTRYIFEDNINRQQLTCALVKGIFPGTPAEAIQFELAQQGLLLKDELLLSFDAWLVIEQQFNKLMLEWEGPDVPIYIFPITTGFEKNGIASPKGICLFISTQLTKQELLALFTHEYHHSCRRAFINNPPRLLDSIILEGLAEDAVACMFGQDYLSPWTQRYSLEKVQSYWNSHFKSALYKTGVMQHKPFLFGDKQLNLPPWIGYCLGYQIVQVFKEKCGPFSLTTLMRMSAEDIIDGADFKRD